MTETGTAGAAVAGVRTEEAGTGEEGTGAGAAGGVTAEAAAEAGRDTTAPADASTRHACSLLPCCG